MVETGLAGWGARIRTWEWRNQDPLHLVKVYRSVAVFENSLARGGSFAVEQRRFVVCISY
jgi:phage tail sheath protein FI